MKNAQDEGLKPQTTDIVVSAVVIDKSQENPPQIQTQQVKEETLKSSPVTEALPKLENSSSISPPSSREIAHSLDQVVLKEISALVTEGNDRINHVAENGILLLGKTGSGKSTLAHVIAGRKLQAIFADEVYLTKEQSVITQLLKLLYRINVKVRMLGFGIVQVLRILQG